MRISISTKIIFLVTLMLIATTVFFGKQSSKLFEEKLYDRENQSNYETAVSRLKEVESTLQAAKSRLEVIGTLAAQESLRGGATSPATAGPSGGTDQVSLNFFKDKSMVSFEVYKISSKGISLVTRRVREELLESLNLDKSYIDYIRTYAPFPIRTVAMKNVEIINSSFPAGPPLFTMGVPVLQDEFGNVSHIALADFTLGQLQKSFTEKSARTLFLTDKNGNLLAHQDENKAISRQNFSYLPIVEAAKRDHNILPRQNAYVDPSDNMEMIGAYARSVFGVIVYSQIERDKVLEPAKEVKNQAIFIAGTMIAVALFLSFIFSITLTSPIEKLASLIALVAKGNFNVRARMQVTSDDEVGDLARAFDSMTDGLKERDKVKNLFSKFHGSSIAEDILKNNIGVGGQNKEVTVFFSDIRGFTAFSEKNTPEEVVNMLNEYFAVMVGIITKNGGVVDKFIGDAIMAVWGAPKGAPLDTKNALQACLEMRKSLLELNNKRIDRGQPPIKIGMGLHCGPAISGTIGSQERMEYTVIGDTVNITSRIESSTKAFGTDLLVSQDVVNKVAESFVLEFGGAAEVKGKSEPLKLYKVRGFIHKDGKQELIQTPYSDYAKEHAEKVKVA